jgi:hypothetical protein
MVRVWNVGVRVPNGSVPMSVTVRSNRHGIVEVFVMPVIVPVSVLVL